MRKCSHNQPDKEVIDMPKKRVPYFNYNTVTINGHQYFKAYALNSDKKLIIVYGKTIDELCQKYEEAEARNTQLASERHY